MTLKLNKQEQQTLKLKHIKPALFTCIHHTLYTHVTSSDSSPVMTSGADDP